MDGPCIESSKVGKPNGVWREPKLNTLPRGGLVVKLNGTEGRGQEVASTAESDDVLAGSASASAEGLLIEADIAFLVHRTLRAVN